MYPPEVKHQHGYIYAVPVFTFILQLRLFRITVGIQLLSLAAHDLHQPPTHWESVRAMRMRER